MKNIDTLLKHLFVEGTRNDLLVESLIIKCFDIKSIFEMGAGSGGWSLLQHKLSTRNIKFYMSENFEYADTGLINKYKEKNIFWPTNITELVNFILKSDDTIEFKVFEDTHRHIRNKQIDLFRIDGHDTDYTQIIDTLIANDVKVIIADDINPNAGGIDRFFALQEYVFNGQLDFIWAGKKTGAWINKNLDKELVYNEIKNNLTDYRYKTIKFKNKMYTHMCTK